jgi:hypothetical protein
LKERYNLNIEIVSTHLIYRVDSLHDSVFEQLKVAQFYGVIHAVVLEILEEEIINK